MNISELHYAFSTKKIHPLPELRAQLHEMEHKKSGAKLVWLQREEENKTFAIAFQTQPWDDTGIFHILEHSVLCGSERYAVKEPFVELMKGSLNTFLNAMTFPDKTVYPVSSRNDQDFMNLMRVYMDAVLHPALYHKPEIFYQEGWHYELDEAGNPSYKGVVFNEMKGAFSSPDTLLRNEIQHTLFPDTCYHYVSGGDPKHIPKLTYEKFVETHQRLYHPSNAYIFLNGSMDIAHVLSVLDEEFLSGYERIAPPAPIPLQQPVKSDCTTIHYALSPQESLEGKARLANGYVVGTFENREDMIALQAIADVICGDNLAPLKRSLLEKGFAHNVRLSLQDSSLQPWMMLELQQIEKSNLDQINATIQEQLQQIVRNGLDKERLTATLANLEFRMRERDYGNMPQGIILSLDALDSWLYGGSPVANLEVGDLFENLRKKCDTDYFETLLERALLNNHHSCQVLMVPSHTLEQTIQAEETAHLQAAQKSWSEEEISAIRERQSKLEIWQRTPDWRKIWQPCQNCIWTKFHPNPPISP